MFIEPSDQLNSGATTLTSQTQTQPKYTTGTHVARKSTTKIGNNVTRYKYRHTNHQESTSWLDHKVSPVLLPHRSDSRTCAHRQKIRGKWSDLIGQISETNLSTNQSSTTLQHNALLPTLHDELRANTNNCMTSVLGSKTLPEQG